ncbi:alpha/beta fold hydrolase [Sphaerisporangium sp. TRM90804]|uniref:alpha/beta fold hydrolase n=1 Tax=Sphaerisporangium sp. TRM90804 TaxID=3031113 RepID=UPI00244A0B11|nr:alpha/beta fold hydrolase [Sphaerisporangium sp. TRM90804]MDH2424977.1 alpha/beta fold hydrolase [Sphaerisporangium sp. TRM90804]
MDGIAPNIGPAFKAARLGHFRDASAYARYRRAYDRAMAGLPAPSATLDVPTRFGTVRVYRFGPADGVPVLLLPGRTAAAPMWEANLAGLARSRPVYAADLIGEPGLSVQTRRLASSDDQASWLASLIDGLPERALHVLGLSIGGWSALNLAVHRPAGVRSLILLEPAATFGPITWKVVVISLGAVLPMPAAVRRRLLSWIAAGADASEDDPVAALIDSGMRDFTADLPRPGYPTDEQIAGIDLPTLVIIGGRSVIHDPGKAAARARRLLRHGTVELWPEASHAVNGEFPDRIAGTVDAFLNKVEATW